MKSGPSPAAQTVFYLREENQRLFEENRQLRERNASLVNQVENWRRTMELPEGLLRCAICHIPKPMAEFWRDRSRPRGFRSYCKSCDKSRYPQIGGRHRRLTVIEVAGNEHLEKA
jgi:RNase P subunit RPR2